MKTRRVGDGWVGGAKGGCFKREVGGGRWEGEGAGHQEAHTKHAFDFFF